MSKLITFNYAGLLRTSAALIAITGMLSGIPALADGNDNSAVRFEARQLFGARHDFSAESQASQQTPPVIPVDELDLDSSGLIETYQPTGLTVTKNNAFFQNLGTNGRTCFSCHQPDQGWTVSAASVQRRFYLSQGLDPIFRPVDGAVCPNADTSTFRARLQAYNLLLSKGLIRIGLPIPAGSEFSIAGVNDPNGCNTNPATGLTSPTTGTVSVYRRPLPSTNLRLDSTVMWDGREGGLLPPGFAPAGQPTLIQDLSQQAIDATTGHAQAATPPTAAQVADIVNFEMGVSTAQVFDANAGPLNIAGATGGAVALSTTPFYIGINDPLGLNPTGAAFASVIFNLYDSWANIQKGLFAAGRASVARGQVIFNTRTINITGVAGINDVLNVSSFAGSCGTCHDTPNGGDHSVKAPLSIGITGAGPDAPPALNISGLPVFTVTCSVATAFHPANTPFYVTDIGRAMLSGKCADVGKTKGPILRGLASRAPFFHNGSAATLTDAVNFYNLRFNIGFTNQEIADLVAFLKTL